jgi:RNA polymerase sigma-B factor
MSATPTPFDARRRERSTRSRRTNEILAAISRADPHERECLLEDLVAVNMPVAASIAKRYRHRGVPDDDLEQVAYLALVRVAHTFDPARGHDFLSYAVPSIRGEVRRYFRDQGWMVRPPRGVQEMQGRIASTESELASRLGHPASPAELADELDEPVADVEEALAASGCFTPTSLDQVTDSATASVGERLGIDEAGLDAAEARMVLSPVIRRLTARDRTILSMRFFGQHTQQEIGDAIRVTQMQVSRLLADLLGRLRDEIETSPPAQADRVSDGRRSRCERSS